MPKKTSPLLSDLAVEFYSTHWDNLNAGTTYTLESGRILYRRTLRELAGRFTEGELSLMLDVSNGTVLTPGLAGQQITAQVADGIDLDGLADKWEVNRAELIEKLGKLPVYALSCLEVWACAFWRSPNQFGVVGEYSGVDVDAWIKPLVK